MKCVQTDRRLLMVNRSQLFTLSIVFLVSSRLVQHRLILMKYKCVFSHMLYRIKTILSKLAVNPKWDSG